MVPIINRFNSSVGKKLITGITGLGLVGFLLAHLTGNFLLLVGKDAFNHYAHWLHELGHGAVIPLAELGLLAFFGFHAVTGVRIWVNKTRARKSRYAVSGNAGGASKKTVASKSMLISGILMLVFVVLHVIHFKFGPDAGDGYTYIDKHGEEMRDLYTLVVEEFKKVPMVMLYVGAMIFLGLHLRHGVWSAIQSLGLARPQLSGLIYTFSLLLAIVLALGFIVLPVWILCFFDDPSAAELVSDLTTGVSP